MIFKPGDVIEQEKPFAAVLDLKEKRKRCDNCFAEFPKLKRCSKCKIMFYCSEQCQKSDWKHGHKYTECNVYQLCNANKRTDPKKKTFIDYDTPRLLLRIYLYSFYVPSKLTKSHTTFESKIRSMDRLMEHKADVKDHKDRMLIFNDIKMMFEESNIKYDEQLLFRLFCKMYINGFSIMNSMLLEIGRAVFILSSQFDHSCVPNAITQFFGKNIEVRAIQEIDTSKQEIFVSYLNVMEKIDKRQEILARGYYFKCQCERCVFELKHFIEQNPTKQLLNDAACKCGPDEIMTGTFDPNQNKTNDQTVIENDKKKENLKSKDDVKSKSDAKSKTKIIKKDANDAKKSKTSAKSTNEQQQSDDWQQVKKNRNQKAKKDDQKSTVPELAIVDKSNELKQQTKPNKPLVESTIEIRVDESNKIDEKSNDKSQKIETTDQQHLSVGDNGQLKANKVRSTTRSPHQTLKSRQNSKSPLPRSKLARSPLPGNRLRLSKSPLPKTKKTNNDKSPITPPPTRFVPYTEIERECLSKFDDLNKKFTENVEKKCWPEAYDLSKQLYKCYLTYYRDDYSSEISLHLIQMLQIKRNILREKFNLDDSEVNDLFNQLGKNVLVTHGIDHALYKRDYLDLCETIQTNTKLVQNK